MLNNRKTLLKMFSRWLVVMYGYNHCATEILQQDANDIDNIAVVAVPRPKAIDMEVSVLMLQIFNETKITDVIRSFSLSYFDV